VLLRSRGVGTLVLSGIGKGGVVLSTLRHAAEADYRLVVLSDACADSDDEVHRVLMQKVFPRQAEVITVSEWIAGLTEPETGPVIENTPPGRHDGPEVSGGSPIL